MNLKSPELISRHRPSLPWTGFASGRGESSRATVGARASPCCFASAASRFAASTSSAGSEERTAAKARWSVRTSCGRCALRARKPGSLSEVPDPGVAPSAAGWL